MYSSTSLPLLPSAFGNGYGAGSGSAASLAQLSASAVSGLRAVNTAFATRGTLTSSNAGPMTLLTLQGPYDGADPASRVGIFSVRRFNDGVGANMQYENGIKVQAATEALARAGVATPVAALAKTDAYTVPYVAVGHHGVYSTGVYNALPLDKQVYVGGAVTTALTATNPAAPRPGGGQVVAEFGNGTKAVTTPCTPGYDPVSLAGMLAQQQDFIPGVTLFSAPRGYGDVANLGVSGAGMVERLGSGDVLGAVIASGGGPVVAGIVPF
jgi:hypothetical protein